MDSCKENLYLFRATLELAKRAKSAAKNKHNTSLSKILARKPSPRCKTWD